MATFGGGSVKLQKLMGDVDLSVDRSSTDFTTNCYAAIDLPPGTYRFTIATATAVYGGIASIPELNEF